MQLVGLDDLQHPTAGPCDGGAERCAMVGIGEDTLDEGEESARAPIEDEPRAIAILHVGGVDDDVQQRPSVSTRMCRLQPVTFLPAS